MKLKKFKNVARVLCLTLTMLIASSFYLTGSKVKAAVSSEGQAVVAEARKYIGKPYVWGATGPNSFDCSGLTQYVYRQALGIEIGRTTWDQIKSGKEVSYSELQPGDLVFTKSDLSHVQLYVGNGMVIHAPEPGRNVEEVQIYNFYRARRIINGGSSQGSSFSSSINSTSQPLISNVVIKAGTNFYSGPSSSSVINGNVSTSGYKVNVYAKYGQWLLVSNGTKQWINANQVQSTPSLPIRNKVTVTADKVSFRENPASTETITGERPKGTALNVYSEYNGWYLVNITTELQWVKASEVVITGTTSIPSVTPSASPIGQCISPVNTKCYASPNDSSTINGVISGEKCLNYYAKYGEWYLVNKTTPQWIKVPKRFLDDVTASSKPLISNVIIKAGTNFYAEPTTSSSVNGNVSASGYKVNVYAKYGQWLLVNNGTKQWINASQVQSMPSLSITKKVVVDVNTINFYENPTNNDKVTGSRPKGTSLNVYGELNGWYLVNTTTDLQWVRASEVK